jgi:uroporphyrinogen-III synthase
VLPVIAITPVEHKDAEVYIRELDQANVAIFISANAVEQSIPLIQRDAPKNWHQHTRLAVIGSATRAALEDAGLQADIIPKTGYNSEGLLEHPEMQAVAGKRVVIFKGVGGRMLLANTLQARGATVIEAITYRRELATSDPTYVQQQLRAGTITAVVVMSNESLDNLIAIVGLKHLLGTPLVVISERTAKHARTLGFDRVRLVAPRADDHSIFEALMEQNGNTDR